MLGRDAVTERRACRVLGQARNTQRRQACVADDEPQLVKRIVWMASEYGRYGYRRFTALLRAEGWWVNHKRVERIWRQEGLKVPAKQPKWRRLWLGDGSCIRLRPTYRNHFWSFRLVMDRTAEGRAFRTLTIVDEFTRACLAIDVSRKLTSEDVLEKLSDLFVRKGVPDHIRSDNGSAFTAKRVREWLERGGARTLSRTPCRTSALPPGKGRILPYGATHKNPRWVKNVMLTPGRIREHAAKISKAESTFAIIAVYVDSASPWKPQLT
jgi:putative transposase